MRRCDQVILAAAVLLALAGVGEAIRCYVCNSTDDENCLDPFEKGEYYLQDCDNSIPNDTERPLCRKIYQDVRGDFRIFRYCGWELLRKHYDCYFTSSTNDIKTTVCQCFEDGCNGVGHTSPTLLTLVVPALLLGLFFFPFRDKA